MMDHDALRDLANDLCGCGDRTGRIIRELVDENDQTRKALEAAKLWIEECSDPCGEPYNTICNALRPRHGNDLQLCDGNSPRHTDPQPFQMAMRDSIALAIKMLSEHIEQYHDYDEETAEWRDLRGIMHHLQGTLIDENESDENEWIPIEEFRGEPNTTPMAWWWNTTWAGHGYLEVDEVLLGKNGEVVGKGKCGADYCSHVKLVREGELPDPPHGKT